MNPSEENDRFVAGSNKRYLIEKYLNNEELDEDEEELWEKYQLHSLLKDSNDEYSI